MDRTETPTESRLNALRKAGLVPHSPLATRCARSAAVLVAVLPAAGAVYGWSRAWATGGAGPSVGSVALGVLLPPGIGVVVALFVGTVQTGFLTRPGAVGGRSSLGSPVRLDSGPLLRGLFFLLGIGAGLLMFRLYVPAVVRLVNLGADGVTFWAGALYRGLLVPTILILGLLSLLGWSASRLLFLNEHRMTREEVSSEGGDDDG